MARDVYHQNVREALEKEGWKITHDPFPMTVEKIDYEIDLGAELIAAEKGDVKIAVEIKSFVSKSTISEFHRTVGQFLDYYLALKVYDPNRVLYLAVPEPTYNTFFNKNVVQEALKIINAKLIIYNIQQNVIVSWIK